MRYRDMDDYQNLGRPVDDNFVFYSIVLGMMMGVSFIVFGFKVKRYWMVIWGQV